MSSNTRNPDPTEIRAASDWFGQSNDPVRQQLAAAFSAQATSPQPNAFWESDSTIKGLTNSSLFGRRMVDTMGDELIASLEAAMFSLRNENASERYRKASKLCAEVAPVLSTLAQAEQNREYAIYGEKYYRTQVTQPSTNQYMQVFHHKPLEHPVIIGDEVCETEHLTDAKRWDLGANLDGHWMMDQDTRYKVTEQRDGTFVGGPYKYIVGRVAPDQDFTDFKSETPTERNTETTVHRASAPKSGRSSDTDSWSDRSPPRSRSPRRRQIYTPPSSTETSPKKRVHWDQALDMDTKSRRGSVRDTRSERSSSQAVRNTTAPRQSSSSNSRYFGGSRVPSYQPHSTLNSVRPIMVASY